MGALLPCLKQLQLGQLVRAGAALLAYGGNPSKPWAGMWFVSLQVGVVIGSAEYVLGMVHSFLGHGALITSGCCTKTLGRHLAGATVTTFSGAASA
jgi:hypothetical protein